MKEMERSKWLKYEQSLDLNQIEFNKNLERLTLAGYTHFLLLLCSLLILFVCLFVLFLRLNYVSLKLFSRTSESHLLLVVSVKFTLSPAGMKPPL